jgi:hypothetical protein
MNGYVRGICICEKAGDPMQELTEVEAIAGQGLKGDRYATAEGSWNKGELGKRQVTLLNGMFVAGSGFKFPETRRNIMTWGVELMYLFGREFQIGEARFRGVKYCDPCDRPQKLSRSSHDFRASFLDRGGLIAEVVKEGLIKLHDPIIPPPKKY